MAIANYTTTVPVDRTVGEIMSTLSKMGARSVGVRYDDGTPSGIGFELVTDHGPRTFELPVQMAGVAAALRAEKVQAQYQRPEHVTRVAWRIARDWLRAQAALIEARMAQLDEVMLPYLKVDPDRTLYQAYREREQAALEAGGT